MSRKKTPASESAAWLRHNTQRTETVKTLLRLEYAASRMSEALGRLRVTSGEVRSMTGWGPYDTLGAAGMLLEDARALTAMLEEVQDAAHRAKSCAWVLSQTAVSMEMRQRDEQIEQGTRLEQG